MNIISNILDSFTDEDFIANRRFSNKDEHIKILIKNFEFNNFNNFKFITFKESLKNSNSDYYHFISYLSPLKDVLKKYPTLPINYDFLLKLKTQTNYKLIFFNHHESDDISSLKILGDFLKNENILDENVWFVNNNAKLQSDKDFLKLNVNVYTTNQIPKIASYTLYNFNIPEFKLNKEYFFSCYNGHARLHRYATIIHLKKEGLLDFTDYSLIYNKKFNVSNYENYFNVNEYSKEIGEVMEIEHKSSQYEDRKFLERYLKNDHIDNMGLNNYNHYKESYVSIITETFFESNQISITEKSFRPFAFYQIPIIVSTYGHINEMRKRYDFDWFDDIVNHDYDEIENPKKRLESIKNELVKLFSNKSKIIDFYKNNQDRFFKNRELLKKIAEDKSDMNFYNTLTTEKKELI
jgi:hypothetical protein